MSTATTTKQAATVQPAMQQGAITKTPETTITYVPLGETEAIHLTLARVKQFLCIPTKSGRMPTDEQVVKYMMLCKAQSLNPWVNDAYLVGYDGKDGPQFSLITAHQSFLKRAEASPEFDGIESGVIVARGETITERQGDLLLNGEVLVGAWARVHRRDRSVPSYDALNLKTFDTGRSRWAADPAGMIVKCAEASALRKAFPSTLAAMYCKEEMDRQRDSMPEVHVEVKPKVERMAERLLATSTPVAAITEQPETPKPDATDLAPQHDVYTATLHEIGQVKTSQQAAQLALKIAGYLSGGEITQDQADELTEKLRVEMN